MDTVFEVSYQRTKEVIKEFYRYHYFQKPFFIIVDIVIFVSFCINIGFLIAGNKPYIYALVLAPALLLYQFLLYFWAVKSMTDRDRELSKGETTTVNISFTDTEIISDTSTGSHTVKGLDTLKSVYETKNLILLNTQTNFTHILPKQCFVKGSVEDFAEYLQSHGVKTRLKRSAKSTEQK